jgi:hypothetical protein
MVIEVPRAPPFASTKVPVVEAFTPAVIDEVAVSAGTETEDPPEDPEYEITNVARGLVPEAYVPWSFHVPALELPLQ